MKALIRSWSATPESKRLLDDIRNNDKKIVFRPSPHEIGVPDLQARKKVVLEATQSMVQAFGVRDMSEILWLARERFIAHQVYVEVIRGATLQEKE